jgi:excisionase family DNA binding protein
VDSIEWRGLLVSAAASRSVLLERSKPNTPVLALSVSEACEALGVSWDLWREHIEGDVRIVRVGRRKLIAVSELQKWLDEHGARILDV